MSCKIIKHKNEGQMKMLINNNPYTRIILWKYKPSSFATQLTILYCLRFGLQEMLPLSKFPSHKFIFNSSNFDVIIQNNKEGDEMQYFFDKEVLKNTKRFCKDT